MPDPKTDVTPGPWKFDDMDDVSGSDEGACFANGPDNAAFITNAANAMFALAAHLNKSPADVARWAADGGVERMVASLAHDEVTTDDDGNAWKCGCEFCALAALPDAKENT